MVSCARMITLCLATRNPHKAEEIRAIIGAEFRYLTLNELPTAPAVMEDAGTFAGNATKKAVELAKAVADLQRPKAKGQRPNSKVESSSHVFVLADDSGLEVDALKGTPGVNSARFAALESGKRGTAPDVENNAKLLRLLKDVPFEKRTARFRCVLALTPVISAEPANASPLCYAEDPELQTELFEGTCEGRIALAPRGASGVGYDPLFIPLRHEETFAELGEEVKNRLSHRAKALAKLKRWLEARWQP